MVETVQSKSLTPTEKFRWSSVLLGLALILCLVLLSWGWSRVSTPDPYVQTVLSLVGDPVRGRDIFLQNCASCHGVQGAGHVGPSLQGVTKRRSAQQIIAQVTGGKTPPMPQFQPSPQAMADLLRYLEQLPAK
ncbi:MAG: cytochrome c [Gloeomargarita sp. SKYBB_i_bin120]|nr:cytochrome c [Gloeomargarita sp. SKYG98]MCS7291715.1 cytochrome c [Gloeomargarita sp. SKYB120]MDW8177274.1 cytochrome c [Gloeomargarita sp. SKYBB_i_bin120]